MFANDRRSIAIAVGALMLAGIGAAALIRHADNRPAGQPAVVTYPAPPQADLSDIDGYYPSIPRPAYIRQPGNEEAAQPAYETAPSGYSVRNQRRAPRTRRKVHYGRSRKRSFEIVAGSGAAGAAIGAIAGGGKGAAIGGLSGAGVGFVYDRLTHNH